MSREHSGDHDSPRSLRVLAPAKVNLDLEVFGKRPDGFHELTTTMLALDLADELTLRPSSEPGIQLTVRGPQASSDVPSDGRNLAVAAAGAVLEVAQARGQVDPHAGLDVQLEKYVPSQAGLGGGSSDAAAAVLGAASLLGLDPLDSKLTEALARLGSDTSFFLEAAACGLARCTGRGELVQPIEPAAGTEVPWTILLVTPDVTVSTGKVFALVDPASWSEEESPSALLDAHAFARCGLDEARASLFNRLERYAILAEPALARWREALDAAGLGHAMLSGSGSSFFALFADPIDALRARRRLGIERKARDLGLRGQWVVSAAGAGVKIR